MASRGERVSPDGTERCPSTYSIRGGVKALVTSTDRVLLIQERHADGSTFWTLPGGGLHSDERAADGLRRELAEELGCLPYVGEQVANFWYSHQNAPLVTWYGVFECSLLTAPRPVVDEGVLDYRWTAPESLPTTTLPQVKRIVHAASDA